MRWLFVPLVAFCLTGCGVTAAPKIEQIELRYSGPVATDVRINPSGDGHFHISVPEPVGRSGAFKLRQQDFRSFLTKLEPYRARAVAFSEASARKFSRARCPPDVPFRLHAGAMYVRWIGPSTDEHTLIDFGCDAERNAQRNQSLRDVFYSLPLPD